MITDFYAALQKLLNEVHDLRLEAGNPSLRSAVTEARAALAEQPVMPTDEELREMFNENNWNYISPETFEDIARAVLARWGNPAPQPPAEGEVAELVAWLEEEADIYAYIGNTDAASKCNRAAELLQHLSPPQPVPVSERLQQMEDLAADAVAGLRYIEQSHGRLYGVGWDRVYKKADRLKPAHALPVPGQEV